MSTPTEPLSGGLESIIVLGIIPGLKVLLIGAVFSSFLLPATVVLFVFSTPTLRRRPHFILNLCAIALGLTQGIIIVYVVVKEFELAPPSPKVISVITALSIVGPICVQTILFLRVLAVYPPWHQSVPARFGIYGPAIAMKVARLVNAGYLLYTIQRGNNAKTIVTQSAAIWSSPFAKSELSLQLADDVYISTLFLLKIHAGVRRSGKQLRYSNQPRITLSQGSYAVRLRTLFWIALSNFVFPVIFDIAQLILILCNYSYTEGSYVVIVNNYISILSVLFSTIWASGTNRMGEGFQAPPQTTTTASVPTTTRTARRSPRATSRSPRSSSAPGRTGRRCWFRPS